MTAEQEQARDEAATARCKSSEQPQLRLGTRVGSLGVWIHRS
jgi:hypothetical protein